MMKRSNISVGTRGKVMMAIAKPGVVIMHVIQRGRLSVELWRRVRMMK
jgi:hypothetical protein